MNLRISSVKYSTAIRTAVLTRNCFEKTVFDWKYYWREVIIKYFLKCNEKIVETDESLFDHGKYNLQRSIRKVRGFGGFNVKSKVGLAD